MTSLAWGKHFSAQARAMVLAMCTRFGFDPSWLMACMKFESDLDPAKRNPTSSGTGLIQFMAATAEKLGTTVDALAAMTIEEQLAFVERYFEPYAGKIKTLSDCYMAILWPLAIGDAEDAVIFQPGSRAFLANRGLDIDHDGAVTKAEAAQFVVKALAEGLLDGNRFDSSETQPVAPIEDRSMPSPTRSTMDPLTLLSVFGPLIGKIIPQVAGFLTSDKAKSNLGMVGTIFDTVTSAVGAPNLQAAIEAMQDPVTGQAAALAAQKAVVTHPEIMQFLEVGGGFAAARDADAKVQAAAQLPDARPFYEVSAVFWVSVLLLPLVYWLVGSLIVGGTSIPSDAPWYIQIFRIFGGVWNGESRSGGFNLVIGLVLGGICGVYYGISVTQAKQQSASSTDPTKG